MASGEAVVNFCAMKRMFSWTLNDIDKIKHEHLQVLVPPLLVGEKRNFDQFLKISPIEALFNGTKYVANCRVEMSTKNPYTSNYCVDYVYIEISPIPGMITGWYEMNDGGSHPLSLNGMSFLPVYTRNSETLRVSFKIPNPETLMKKVSFHFDVTAFCTNTYKVLPFQQSNKLELCNELKAMWKDDQEAEFTIKCKNEEFKVIKPIMAARSPVFKAMFETEMKEKSQNFVEIKEFEPKIVGKMIEFCENDAIKDCEGCEDELFKIAHLYQIQQLMYFAVEKMAENIKHENVVTYIQLADLYELKEFKNWCLQYAQRNNIVVAV